MAKRRRRSIIGGVVKEENEGYGMEEEEEDVEVSDLFTDDVDLDLFVGDPS